MVRAILRFDTSSNDIGKLAEIHLPSLPDNLFIPAIIEAEPQKGEWAKVTEAHEIIGYDRDFRDGYAQAPEERPKGEWIGDTGYESYQGSYEAYKCSKCGYSRHWRDYYSNKYNFCPNCGVRMRGSKNETN